MEIIEKVGYFTMISGTIGSDVYTFIAFIQWRSIETAKTGLISL